jgi:hypothetical protein
MPNFGDEACPSVVTRCAPPSTERSQQFHIDVTVDDVEQAEREVLALGATKTDLQPGKDEKLARLPRSRRPPILLVLGLVDWQ